GLRGEIWLQIDEPIWSRKRELPAAYSQFLRLATSLDRATAIGLHTCAAERPFVPAAVVKLCRFFSLSFREEPLRPEEDEFWKRANKGGLHFVAGVLPKPGEPLAEMGGTFPWRGQKVWLSARCGLTEWTPAEVENFPNKD